MPKYSSGARHAYSRQQRCSIASVVFMFFLREMKLVMFRKISPNWFIMTRSDAEQHPSVAHAATQSSTQVWHTQEFARG